MIRDPSEVKEKIKRNPTEEQVQTSCSKSVMCLQNKEVPVARAGDRGCQGVSLDRLAGPRRKRVL